MVLTVVLFADFLFSDKVLYGTDFMDLGYYALKYFRDYVLRYHEYPLWDPHIHGGLPFVEAMHGAIFFPIAVPLRLLLPPHRSFGMTEMLYVLLAGWFMYILLRHYGLSQGASLLGAMSYMFSPLLVSLVYAGHDGKMSVIALLPLCVWLLERAMIRLRLLDFAIFGAAYSLLILTAHPQMAYFASWLLGALFVFRLVRGIVLRRYSPARGAAVFGLFVLAIALGVGIASVQLLPPFHYVSHYSVRTASTERGIAFANTWRLNVEDLVATVFPDFVGLDLGSRQTYWGRNFFRINSMYIGLLVVVLAVGALLALKEPLLRFLAGFSAFAITYSMGTQTPLFYIYYYLIPGVKKFRGPEMLFFTVLFAASVGFAFAVDAAVRLGGEAQEAKKSKGGRRKSPSLARWLLWVCVAFSLALIFLSVFGKPLAAWWLKAAPNPQGVNVGAKLAALARNFPIFLKSSWLALVLCWVVVGLLVWRMRTPKLSPAAVFAVAAIALVADAWRIGRPFVRAKDPNVFFGKPPVVDYLQARWRESGPFRTLALPRTLTYTQLGSFGLDAVTFSELHGNQLRWYDEFTGRHERPQNIQKYLHFWDILNIEYVLSPQAISAPNLELIGTFGGISVYRNRSSFPRARAFFNWETTSHQAAMLRLTSPDFVQDSTVNYRTTLLVEGDPGISPPALPESLLVRTYAAGRIVDNKDDEFTVEIDMPYDGLLFISQSWYPAWRAEEGERELPVLRADYAFMAVPLRAGSHRVRFYYYSPLLVRSLWASASSAALTALLVCACALWETKRRSR